MSRALVAALLAAIGVGTTVGGARAATVAVGLDSSKVGSRTSDRYVSFAVDVDQVVGGEFWNQAPGGTGNAPVAVYDFTRPRLRKLAAALSPAYLRISGTASNKTYYDLSDNPSITPPAGFQRVMTRKQWDGVNAFAQDLGLQVDLGLNAGPGPLNASLVWQRANAEELLRYTAQRKYPLAVVEFGNEPNLFQLSGMPAAYDAGDYAAGLRRADAVREDEVPRARLMGPGTYFDNLGQETNIPGAVFGPTQAQILPRVRGLYDLLTWHSYPAVSTRCGAVGQKVPDDQLDPAFLDGVLRGYGRLKALGAKEAPGKRIWYGEGASSSCGGQPGYSNRFAASFWYLNALGALSQRGLEVFVRQTLSGSDYGLIDDTNLRPDPDYWAALLWRRLMGTRQLQPKLTGAPARFRAFAGCSRGGRGTTLLVLNLEQGKKVSVRLEGGARPRDVYVANASKLKSRTVALNGRNLTTDADGDVPDFRPTRTTASMLTLAPASYAFVTDPAGAPKVCG